MSLIDRARDFVRAELFRLTGPATTVARPRAEPRVPAPRIGRPQVINNGWRNFLDGILKELQTPEVMTFEIIDAMRRFPTLADCEETGRSILADTLFAMRSPGSDVARKLGQDLIDELVPGITTRSRHLRWGGSIAQVIHELRDIEVTVITPEGEQRFEMPGAYWPRRLRWLSVRDRSMKLLTDDLGDLIGCTFNGRTITGPEFFAVVNGDEDGSGVIWETGHANSYTPWAGFKRILTHLLMYTSQKGNPPGKAFVPEPAEWTQMRKVGDEGDDPEPEDPGDWLGSQLLNLWSGGWITLPGKHRELREGGVEPARMFDIEYLDVPARADEFDKAMNACRVLMVEGWFVGLPGDAMAAMKQGTRNLFTKQKLRASEFAMQLHDRLIRPVLELNLGTDLPPTWIEPGPVAENRRELMLELVKTFASAKQQLADGRWVSFESLVDLEATLRGAGGTTRDIDLAAMEDEPQSDMARPEGRPRTDPGAKEFDSDDPEEAQRGEQAEEA